MIIEETSKSEVAIGSTVVRIGNRGYRVSTAPSLENRSGRRLTFETIVFDFMGYERIGHTARPLGDGDNENSELGFNRFNAFEGNPEAAKDHHLEVVEKLAQLLESEVVKSHL